MIGSGMPEMLKIQSCSAEIRRCSALSFQAPDKGLCVVGQKAAFHMFKLLQLCLGVCAKIYGYQKMSDGVVFWPAILRSQALKMPHKFLILVPGPDATWQNTHILNVIST